MYVRILEHSNTHSYKIFEFKYIISIDNFMPAAKEVYKKL